MTKQPFLGIALLAQHWEAPRKGGVNKAHPGYFWPTSGGTPKCGRKNAQKLRIATWNVRTLLDLTNSGRPPRRTALVSKELKNINIDVAALQETRMHGEGQVKEKSHTIFWKGKPEGEPRTAGVGFAISNSLISKLPALPVGICDRIITLRNPLTKNCFVTLVNVYAPTMTHPDQEREAFF